MRRWRRRKRNARSFCFRMERWRRRIWRWPSKLTRRRKSIRKRLWITSGCWEAIRSVPRRVIEVHAPVSGTIVEQNVTAAAGVKSLDNSPNLFTIADLSQLWVICDVYENDLAQVHVGDRAADRTERLSRTRCLADGSRTSGSCWTRTRVRRKCASNCSNECGILRPNMFATVHFVSQGAQTRTVVPASAVLRLQDRDWVFVKGERQSVPPQGSACGRG